MGITPLALTPQNAKFSADSQGIAGNAAFMTYRPLDSAIGPASDAGAAAMSGAEVPQSGLSAEFTGTDISKAHQIFQPADGGALSNSAVNGLNGLDISGISAATTPVAGTEALAMMPPTGTGLEAGALANVAAAGEVSPLVQLILKLPGAMGLVTSFFEFLANFFTTSFTDLLNPAMWAQTAMAAFSNGATHFSSLIMLPANSPLLSSLTNLGQPMFGSDLLSAKLNLSLGNSSYSSLAKGGLDAFHNNGLNVSGDLSPQTAVFEGAPGAAPGGVPNGHLSGPSLTDVGQANHVAGNTRLFSDRMTSGGSFNSMNLAAKTPAPNVGATAGATNLGQSVANNSLGLNPGAAAGSMHQPGSFLNNVRFEGGQQIAGMKTNFVPHAGQEVSYNMAPTAAPQDVGYGAMGSAPNMDASGASYGPSGAVGSELGSVGGNNQQLLAMDQPTQSFKPTLSGADSQFRSAFPSGTQSPLAQQGGQAAGTGLKATQLKLGDSLAGSAPKPVAPGTAGSAASGKLASAPSGKIADAPVSKPAAPAGDSLKAAHKAPAHDASKVHHDAPKVHHDAPKQVAHKVEHAAPKPKVAEAKPVAEARPAQQQIENQIDPNQQAADGTVNETFSADGTMTDGTQIAQTDSTAAAQYTVQKGDSLWNIAKDQLGGGAKWQEIYKLNEHLIGQNPDLIYPGTQLQLPGGAPEIASNGATTMTNYTVQPGDNLWNISKDLTGDATKWGDIYQANQDVIGSNPSLIHPGQQLQIPTADPSAGGTVATNAVDPNAAAMDPNAMGAPQGQPMSANGQEISAGTDSVKSMQMQGNGTEFGATTEQYMPQTQAAPQQVSSYPETDVVSANPAPSGFQPTVHGRGLPVIPANSVPIEAGPGSAMAATLNHGPIDAANAAAATQASAAKGSLVSGGIFSDMKSMFAKNK